MKHLKGVWFSAFLIAALMVTGCEHFESAPPPSAGDQQAGKICAGIAGIKCPDADQYCAMPAGKCMIADMAGVCKIKPQICTMDYRPVCGCNGKTYSNSCAAASAGVSIQYDGECRKQ